MYTIIEQNYAGNKQKSYKFLRINMFAVYSKVKPDIENIRGLNLAVIKLMTVEVYKLPLVHKISKRGMICFAKPGLTEDMYIV
jgi:hypothetical protein